MFRVAFTYGTPIVWENMEERREDMPLSEFKDWLEDVVVMRTAMVYSCGSYRVKAKIVKDVEGHIIFQVTPFVMTHGLHQAFLYGVSLFQNNVKVYTEALLKNPKYQSNSERERVRSLLGLKEDKQ